MWFGFDWPSQAADKLQRELMHTYAASYAQTLPDLRLPSAFPFVVGAMKVNATLVPIGAVCHLRWLCVSSNECSHEAFVQGICGYCGPFSMKNNAWPRWKTPSSWWHKMPPAASDGKRGQTHQQRQHAQSGLPVPCRLHPRQDAPGPYGPAGQHPPVFHHLHMGVAVQHGRIVEVSVGLSPEQAPAAEVVDTQGQLLTIRSHVDTSDPSLLPVRAMHQCFEAVTTAPARWKPFACGRTAWPCTATG
jgi:hypothetical protein